jgi:predicted dehydrogenase
MKILVVGCGSIGKRHLRNLLTIGINKEDVSCVETRDDRIAEVQDYGIKNVYSSLESALSEDKNYDAAIICSPTSLHIDQCNILSSRNINLMIEKPLSSNLDGIEILKKNVKENKLVVLMAYIFRFTPQVQMIKKFIEDKAVGNIYYVRGEFSEYLPDWHPYEDYRTFYMAEKSMGGGSILDQSHIFDLVHYLFGGFKNVKAFNSKISNLELNADDISELIVEMKNGIIASLHTDIFGRQHQKFLEIKGENGNIKWDFYKNEVTIYDPKEQILKVFNKFPTDLNLTYINEIKHFLDCCKNKKNTFAPLEDGIDTMKLILAAEKSHKNENLEII